MSEYMVLFRASDESRRGAMGTPERAQQSLKAWFAWMHDLEQRGALRQRGLPIDAEGRVVRGKDRVVTDGPFVEAKDLVLGFIVVQARDLDEAAELAKGCPMLDGAGSVEIRPVAQLAM